MQVLLVGIWGGLYIFDGYTRLRFGKWNIGVNAKQGEWKEVVWEFCNIWCAEMVWFGFIVPVQGTIRIREA